MKREKIGNWPMAIEEFQLLFSKIVFQINTYNIYFRKYFEKKCISLLGLVSGKETEQEDFDFLTSNLIFL